MQIDLSQAANKIGDLLQLMDRVEPKNAYLFDTVAKVFCRVVSMSILQKYLDKKMGHVSEFSVLSRSASD